MCERGLPIISNKYIGAMYIKRNVQNSLGVDTSSTAMGARITSVLKYLEYRNACVGLAGNNLELAGSGKPELQATAICSRFSG